MQSHKQVKFQNRTLIQFTKMDWLYQNVNKKKNNNHGLIHHYLKIHTFLETQSLWLAFVLVRLALVPYHPKWKWNRGVYKSRNHRVQIHNSTGEFTQICNKLTKQALICCIKTGNMNKFAVATLNKF
jgi:hypothetical protein